MAQPEGYDLEMIRDFLHQLLWEVRVSHFDNTNAKPNNPELTEQRRAIRLASFWRAPPARSWRSC